MSCLEPAIESTELKIEFTLIQQHTIVISVHVIIVLLTALSSRFAHYFNKHLLTYLPT